MQIELKMKQFGDYYDTRVYQTTHNVGGAIMGEDPNSSGAGLSMECLI
jgi:gluconate 2-dehydrogenase alpha chain